MAQGRAGQIGDLRPAIGDEGLASFSGRSRGALWGSSLPRLHGSILKRLEDKKLFTLYRAVDIKDGCAVRVTERRVVEDAVFDADTVGVRRRF
jgi:hypothetical protein